MGRKGYSRIAFMDPSNVNRMRLKTNGKQQSRKDRSEYQDLEDTFHE
jgi:hypothetical protein